MRRLVSLVLILQLCLPVFAQNAQSSSNAAAPSGPILGFMNANVNGERGWEEKFKAIPSPDKAREYMQLLSARPHHVGSPYDKQNAEWILSKFKEWGWDAHIETFNVLFPTPKTRLVEMLEPTRFTLKLQEPPVVGDPTSSQQSEQLPTYNAYSRDGDVTAPLVFVNYGVVKDYEELERQGVSVKGAIVIAKYGNSWRGIKPKIAAEHGAVGCLIYSDPADDGYGPGDTFPEGPMRPREGVQRGSVMDMPQYPGDPLTPGIGATPDAKRLKVEDAPTITKIPVLPISYGDAQPLLAALKGPLAPDSFKGGLPITYHLGPGPAKVHLKLAFNWDIKPVYDVIAKIPGAVEPDVWIIRGNHHDGWVNGAQDPISGQIGLLEEARALGELVKQGWKPKRTIIYTAWDGEEPMLLGSTEWAETHAAELQQHAAVYINTDVSGRGFFFAEGSHALESVLTGVEKDVTDPEKNISVWKRAELNDTINGSPDNRKDARSRADLHIGALGSGSDYTTFIDHLGIASLNVGFGGEDDEGIYHSIYDDFYWFTHFSDTTFVYERALSQTVGTTVMRLADADVLPMRFTNLAEQVSKYSDSVKKLLSDRRDAITEDNRRIEEGAFEAVSDPRAPTYAPPKKPVPPFLNFAPLDNATAALQKAAGDYDKGMAEAVNRGQLSEDRLRDINAKITQAERQFLLEDGLPRRPWMKHALYAPGWYTGYGAKTLPGIREAIEEGRYDEAESEIVKAAKVIEAEAKWIDGITQALPGKIQIAAGNLPNGVLPGPTSAYRGDVYRVGNGVTSPKLIQHVEPAYTEAARKAKLNGTLSLLVVVAADGTVQHVDVRPPFLGKGLEESALRAVSQWRFEPGTKNGVPVPVQLSVEVSFRLC